MDFGLCGKCGEVSNFYVEIAREQNEQQDGSRYATPSRQRFDKFVEDCNLEESWADGLGLMESGDRKELLRSESWDAYVDYLSIGLGHERALRKATGMHRKRNMKFAYSGRGQAGTSDGSDEGTGMTTEDGFLPNEAVSWQELWSDDL